MTPIHSAIRHNMTSSQQTIDTSAFNQHQVMDANSGMSFLELPGEIRNLIYKCALSAFADRTQRHPHLTNTYTVDLRHLTSSTYFPSWIHNWTILRSLSRDVRVEIDSLASAIVFPHVIFRHDAHNIEHDFSKLPRILKDRVRRVEIRDPGFLLCDMTSQVLACFQGPLKVLQIQKRWVEDSDMEITESTEIVEDLSVFPQAKGKAILMRRQYNENAYHLIRLLNLKHVVLSFGHYNCHIKLTQDSGLKQAFMEALSQLLGVLACGQSYGPAIEKFTLFCQESDLRNVDFERGLQGGPEPLEFPFHIEGRLRGEDELTLRPTWGAEGWEEEHNRS